VLRQLLVDLAMPRNRLRHPGARIAPSIVTAAMPHKDTVSFFEPANEILELHRALSDTTEQSRLQTGRKAQACLKHV
jgi:hypothetical protein